MTEFILPLSVRVHTRCRTHIEQVSERIHQAWDERSDERGLDEAVTKMIWLAVGIGVAVAATTFFVSVFKQAQANVPNPTAPAP